MSVRGVNELLLFKGYGVDAKRRERCDCGGVITADAMDTGTWPRAVQAHQRTDRHRDWRRTVGW